MATGSSLHPEQIRFGAFELDTHSCELKKSGRHVRLRPQAVKVLAALTRRAGQVVSREELKAEIWGSETFVDFENGLNLCVRQIRAALDDDAEVPRYVETLSRRGYRFIAPVTGAVGESIVEATSPVAARINTSPWKRSAIIAGPLLLLAVLVAFGDPYQLRERIFGVPPMRTIAVLPLLNLSGDSSQDYFADGVTEAITTDLARMETVQVISRSSTMQYKGTKKTLIAIARELHADAIVEGSVQRDGNRVRITAQLIRASTDSHLWAETYERDLSDVLALQDDVASAIAVHVQNRLGGPRPLTLARAEAISPEAYETYLKANYYFDQFDFQKSIEYYNQVIKLAPNYAPAYAHMANPYFFLGFFGAMRPQEAWGKVRELGLLAVEKDGQLPDAHAALAAAKLHYDWDFPGAEREYKRALELNPNDADIRHGYAHYLMAMGRLEESAAESKKAVELDPVDDGLTDCLCWHSYAARQYQSSIQLALEVLRRQPDDVWEMVILGWDYEQAGLPERAITEFKKAVEIDPKDSVMHTFLIGGLGQAYALAGHTVDAHKVLNDLLERARKSYVSPFDLALIYTALGEKDSAFQWLKKAEDEHSTFLVYSKWEPRLDPLRSDPRFVEIMKKIGLPA